MVKLVNILYLLVLSCLFTLILMSRLPGEQTTDDAWPTWAKELNENKPIHLRSVTNCDMDSRCTRFETCADKTCVRFWPRPATQTSACHLVCEQDVRLYEDHFYLKNITDVHAFEGITSDTCVMSYHLMGNTPGLSPKEYETRHSGSDVRSETMDNNVKVALCKVRGVPRASPMKKLSIPAVAIPAVAIPAVTVAIPTYNRIGYVQLTSSAFQSTFPAEDTWIFDDKSSEYGTHDLIGWYGTEHVWQSKKRLKADAMARHILEWFLSTKYDVLVLLDSDLIVAPDWHAELRTGLRESTGLLSLYRSGAPKHKSVSCGDVLCQQPSMGNAGTVWRRDLAKRMLAEMSARDGGFDWGWSEWCTKNKVPMEALKKSAVLHIGMYGSWSHESTAEKSVGFPMGELSTEVRERAEMYLKGAKPVATALARRGDILWVIPAFKRAWSLDLVLKSLSVHEATKILVSKDADSTDIDSVLKKYSVDVIEHPWSCSRHPNRFPAKDESLNKDYKGDTYGNPRSPWATCLKHHWWWMMKQAWSRKPERVCVLEDDTVIHPQAFEWLMGKRGNIKLTPEEIAVPWCLSFKEWQAIDTKTFCEHDDYNWDQTIAWMKEHTHKNEAVVPSVSLSMHVGDCGGWDAGGRDKKCTSEQIVKIRANVERWLSKSFVIDTSKRKWLTAHTKPNGGWGHPKDWAHCIGEKDHCLQWSNVGGCRHHAASDAWLCKFDWMSMNTNDIHVSKGGSNIRDVLDRPENLEFARLDKHSIGIPYIPHGPKEWHHKKLISAATTKKHTCEQTITGTTLFFERIEYANLWHTMNDWLNVHWTLETIGNPHQVTIVWLDGHARGHLDDAWGEIFSARTRYVSEFSGHVCFEKAVWVPKNTPVWNTEMPSGRCGIMDRFVQRVLSVYGITPSLSEDVVIDRQDYRAHPRHKPGTKNDRNIEHLDKMFPLSQVVQLETMTFKEQVQLIANAKSLRGVHGAGLTHLIWLPDGAEVVEWVAPSHASVKLFEHIATWRPKIRYSRAKIPGLQTPLVEKHRLTILIPFREKISDKKSQGSGREKNLREWLEYMSSFLKMPADVIIVEQSQEGTFNKGFLFNVGFKESQNSDYFVLHDVDQIPENPTNDYSFKKCPTHLLTSTSQWNYKKGPSGNVGGALMMTSQKYQEINGYSNNFGGWGREDDNMALRLQKHGGYDSLPTKVGRYKELKHPRVLGLDETEQFHKNVANTHDFLSGLSDLRYETISTTSQRHGSLDVKRIKVREKTKHHLNALSVREKYHDELSLSIGHRLKKYAKGPELHGNKLMERLHVLIEQVDITMKSAQVDYALHGGTLLGAWRHHGFIPWDTDIDVMIRADSLHGLIQHIEAVTGHDSIHWIVRHGLHSDIIPIKVVDKDSGYYVDIFVCFVENNMCLYRWTSPPRKYPLNDWFPSRTCFFDHLKLQCPDSPQNILKMTYKNVGIPEKYKPYTSETFENVSWVDTKQNRNETIQTSDLFAAIDYNAQENKGPWKQGWDYEYDGRFKDGLTVHVVPHSHNDPGWIKTYHTYYSTQTRHILDTVVAALTEDPRRTFIWAEISYFSLWWNDATQQQKEQAKKLVAEKRLDFVTGGWVMNDEASVTARATRWHLQEGREWLKKTFDITPQYSWAIDPFGHSAGQAQVLQELGYKGMLIQRVHYAVKKQLAEKQQLEFQWQTPAGEIFTHMMPFYSYDGPHTCGPDPSVCCQFDFARIGKGKTWTGCPWGTMAVEITEHNVAERSRKWLDQVYKKAMLYRGKHVFVPVGDDFRYQTMDEAHKQFTNYQKMFDWIQVNVPTVKASFSTLTRYFDAVRETNVPRLKGSFFPYSDRKQEYWTGYFNSRIFYKGYDRLLESLIAAVETKCPTVDIHLQKRALGLFQHHDGITGTATSHVVQDYYQTMQKAVTELKLKLKTCLDIAGYVLVNPLSVDTPTMKADEIRPYEEDACVSVPAAGLQFENIKVDGHGRLVQINDTPVHESLVWRSNKPGQGVAGAYLMSVTSKEVILQPIKHTTCIAKRYKQLETTFDMLKRRIRVYNDGTIEFIYDVDIHARNNGELWAVYKPEWLAERLCSDVHGLTWECHIERKDAPLQAKFWPMPTMAWLASATDRMTFTGAQPTGVGFHEGAMVLMLDRRGNQDDARGLGQGITDSRPVEMRFGVLIETEGLKERATEKASAIRNWMLNPTIEIV